MMQLPATRWSMRGPPVSAAPSSTRSSMVFPCVGPMSRRGPFAFCRFGVTKRRTRKVLAPDLADLTAEFRGER